MSASKLSVLAALRDAHVELIAGGGNVARVSNNLDAAIFCVAELIDANREYDAARREYDRITSIDPSDMSGEDLGRISSRFEAAIMRRIAAVERMGDEP